MTRTGVQEWARLLILLLLTAIALLVFLLVQEWCIPSFRGFLLYLGLWGLPLLGLATRPIRWPKIAVWCIFVSVMVGLWLFPLASRPRFFQKVYQIHTGMSVSEVEAQMKDYVNIFQSRGPIRPKRPLPADFTGYVYYFHNVDDWQYNTDMAAVTFRSGRATAVSCYLD
jgi:hypothetical protein